MPLVLSAPLSAGDLLDRLTILAIKRSRVSDPAKLLNVGRELDGLAAVWIAAGLGPWEDAAEAAQLSSVNTALWQVEDALRAMEAERDHGPAFVERARSVYRLNDHRAALKRAVNDRLGSWIVEEKVHPRYGENR